MAQTSAGPPVRFSRTEAREQLPEDLKETFDILCEETLKWSQYYYATSFISYSIIMELVKDGWRKI
jgi:hypothetical protein